MVYLESDIETKRGARLSVPTLVQVGFTTVMSTPVALIRALTLTVPTATFIVHAQIHPIRPLSGAVGKAGEVRRRPTEAPELLVKLSHGGHAA